VDEDGGRKVEEGGGIWKEVEEDKKKGLNVKDNPNLDIWYSQTTLAST